MILLGVMQSRAMCDYSDIVLGSLAIIEDPCKHLAVMYVGQAVLLSACAPRVLHYVLHYCM